MNIVDPDLEDADVPAQAVRALDAAYEPAVQAGHDLVLVRGDNLVRICGNGEVVQLKQLVASESVIATPRLRER